MLAPLVEVRADQSEGRGVSVDGVQVVVSSTSRSGTGIGASRRRCVRREGSLHRNQVGYVRGISSPSLPALRTGCNAQ